MRFKIGYLQRFVWIILLSFSYTNVTYAADVNQEDNILKQLLEAARKHDDQLKIAKAQFEAAKARASQNLSPVLPQIKLNLQASQRNNDCTGCPLTNPAQSDSSVTSTKIELTQSLYEPAKYRAFTATKARAEQFGYLYGVANLDLVTRLLNQYLNILTETDNLRTLGAQRDRLNKQLQVVRARANAGTRSRVDVAEISSNAALSESRYLLSQINLRTFYEGLSASVNLDIKNLPPIRKNLQLPSLDNDDPEYWTNLALEKNLSLLAAKAAVKAAEEDVKISNSGHIPTFDLFVSYMNSDNSFDSYSSTTTQTETGIRFSVPIYVGGRVFAGVRGAKARLQETQGRLELVIVEIKTLVPSLVRRIQQGEDLIAASDEALKARISLVARTESRYNSGAADITDLLLDYERLYEAERSYYSSLYSHIRNYAELYVRSGNLAEDTLNSLYDIGDFSSYDPEKPVY